MLDVTKNGFAELSCDEMTDVNGGFGWGAVVTIAWWTVKIIFSTPTYSY